MLALTAAALLRCWWLASVAHAGDVNEVRGVVHDAQHRPLAQAHLELKAVTSGWSRATVAAANGAFAFAAVPLGDYVLTANRSGFTTATLNLTVISGGSPVLHVQLRSGDQLETVTVSGTPPATMEVFTPTTFVNRQDIELTPGAERSNSLAMITDYVPGAYFVHDQLHVRGGHQVTWEIDGVEIPNTNIASNLGPQLDPKDIDYLEIERGSYPADEGDRTYGVFNVVPRTGFERDNQADVYASGGSYGQTNDAVSLGSHTQDLAYYASLNYNRSSLGLMTPVEEVIHDREDGYGGFGTLSYNLTPTDQLHLVTSARRDDYQIPNSPAQLADDWQREADAFTIFSWVHTFNGSTTLTSSAFYHYNRADFDGASWDFPISTTDLRISNYVGGQEKLRWSSGPNTLDAGLYGFAQWDSQSYNVLFNDGSSSPVAQALDLGGNVEAAWLQDTYRLNSWLSASAGLRGTHFEGLFSEHAVDPRVGVTVSVPNLGWVLRGFWGKFYQPPPLETISGPLLQYAQSSSLGFLPLHGERDNEYQFGLTVPLRDWTFDVDHFQTRVRNFFDHNPLGNSDIFLPITITGALIRATEFTLRSPRFWSGAQVYVTYSNQTADGYGAITGGLTDFSAPSGYYALDHDQRNTVNAGMRADLPWQSYASLNLYLGSGFSNGNAPPSHLPSNGTLDFSVGRQLGTRLTAAITVLNVTNRHLLIDNSLTFDGFHWNYPRQLYASLHYRFGY
jgi:Carboxypeptidase regulatory-like domain/TonB dependent receptor